MFFVEIKLQLKPIPFNIGTIGVTMLRFSELTVLPQAAKLPPLKVVNAQNTNDKNITTVLPLRTAPSQIIASQNRYLLALHHHKSTCICFLENFLNAN